MVNDFKIQVDRKRKEARKSMHVLKPEPGLVAHYEDEGMPYALVEQKAAHDKVYDHGFVSIIPRHMSARNWRDLFWLGVTKLSVHGREFDDICIACSHKIICMQNGLSKLVTFECVASRETLNIELTSRTWREKKNGRGRSKSLAKRTIDMRPSGRITKARDVRGDEHEESSSNQGDHHEQGEEEEKDLRTEPPTQILAITDS